VTHPLVLQLRFTREEFKRGLAGLSDEDARKRLGPMNSISWNIGHLAWQEQRYWLGMMGGELLLPAVDEQFRFGCPPSTPPLDEVWHAWEAIVTAVDPVLDGLTEAQMTEQRPFTNSRGSFTSSLGSLMLRMIYHYWYHNGETQAIRQMLGHTDLAVFVGNIDRDAPYRA
jgi:uncharacterized damage-inducible protein DinB